MKIRAIGFAFAGASCLLLQACCDADCAQQMPAAREVSTASVVPSAPHAMGASMTTLPPRAPSTGPKLAYDVPAGWLELPPTSMRAANFRPAGAPDAECALTLLAGSAGGLAANAQRWASQMGAPPFDQASLAALPRVEFFGGEAALLDLSGDYVAMGERTPRTGQRMVGLLRIDERGSAFLKLTGPADLVERELEAFHALARSFRAKAPGAPEVPASAVTPAAAETPAVSAEPAAPASPAPAGS